MPNFQLLLLIVIFSDMSKTIKIGLGVFAVLFIISAQLFQNTSTYKEFVKKTAVKDSIKSAKEMEENLKAMIPQNQGSDGVVWQVQNHLGKALHNPGSYEPLEWGKVEKKNELYIVVHSYRATNRMNALVKETKTFTMTALGDIVKVE